MENEDRDQGDISGEMEEFLKQQEIESDIQALIDAAREVGFPDYSREEAIKALVQEQEHQQPENE